MSFLIGAEFLASLLGVPSLVADGIVTVTPPIATLFAGKAWGRIKERHLHNKQEFDNVVMVQRTTVVNGKLANRGLWTGPLEELLLGGQDAELIRYIKQAARETTETFPGLLVGSEELQGQVWTAVQGAVSPLIPKDAPRQLMVIVCERWPEMKENNQRILIRIILVSEAYLKLFLVQAPAGLGLETNRQLARKDRLMPWMAQMHFNKNGIYSDPKSKLNLRVVNFADCPWKDDEAEFLAQQAA